MRAAKPDTSSARRELACSTARAVASRIDADTVSGPCRRSPAANRRSTTVPPESAAAEEQFAYQETQLNSQLAAAEAQLEAIAGMGMTELEEQLQDAIAQLQAGLELLDQQRHRGHKLMTLSFS